MSATLFEAFLTANAAALASNTHETLNGIEKLLQARLEKTPTGERKLDVDEEYENEPYEEPHIPGPYEDLSQALASLQLLRGQMGQETRLQNLMLRVQCNLMRENE